MRILLVDDEPDSRSAVADFLCQMGHEVAQARDGMEALEFYKRDSHAMILTDIRMPRLSGLALLKEVVSLQKNPAPDIVLFTGHGDMDCAIEALRAGAYDFILKPLNVDELVALVTRIADHQALLRENQQLRTNLKRIFRKTAGIEDAVFSSPAMKNVEAASHKYYGDRSIPVLIQGETGTGKEVIARLIHYGKIGDDSPFVDINCAALTPGLFESELFGYESGAFTGSRAQGQKGKFDLALGGTLFLDEIAELPLEMQGKFLRVLENKEFFRVGGLNKIRADVRIVCATNVDLMKRIETGAFRQDLYYRLRVGLIHLPPLRERPEDVISLAESFLKRFSREKNKAFRGIAPEAKQKLTAYRWPGNVRELRNAIEWAVFMNDAPILHSMHLPAGLEPATGQESPAGEFRLPGNGFSLDGHLQAIVLQALKMHNGNKKRTAEYLGISRRSLYTHLQNMPQSQGD